MFFLAVRRSGCKRVYHSRWALEGLAKPVGSLHRPTGSFAGKFFVRTLEKLFLRKNFLNFVKILKFLDLTSKRNFSQG